MNNNQGRRRTRRVRQQRKQKNTQISRILLTICMIALVAVVSIGGTIAWLTDASVEIKNTFTPSTINIELKETTGDNYEMVPGAEISKNPKVTYKGGSEAGWLFVKIVKSDNFDSFMTYEIADGWTSLDGETGVYYREMAENANDSAEMSILKGDKINVKNGVTKENMDALTAETYPTLTFTAYAVQKYSFNDAASAWNQAKSLTADRVTSTPVDPNEGTTNP